jgi:hypothetical protein
VGGVRAIDWSVAAVTATVIEPATPALVAVTVAVPGATAVISPELETVRTATSEEAQLAEPVRSSLDRSEYIPVAVSWSVVPAASEGSEGVTPMDCSDLMTAPEPEQAATSKQAAMVRQGAPRKERKGRERDGSMGRASGGGRHGYR